MALLWGRVKAQPPSSAKASRALVPQNVVRPSPNVLMHQGLLATLCKGFPLQAKSYHQKVCK